jgi:hypothetical protein
VLTVSTTHAEISTREMQVLSKSQLIYIATVRKDGNQSKAAPVWFTVSADNNAILIQTGPDSSKAKRIRRSCWVVALPEPATWSLTSVQQRLVKTGGRLIRHARYYWLLLAESHLTRRLFAGMLAKIAMLPSAAG